MFAMQNLTAGQLNALVKKVGGEDTVRGILDDSIVFRIESRPAPQPVIATFTVDTTNASMPEAWKKDGRWKVEEHKSLGIVTVRFADGEMYINDRKVGEYLAEKQKGGVIGGHDLRKELADKSTLPDAILDLLIKEQDNPAVKVFLQKYKGKCPFFWGTIYRFPDGYLYVRCLNRDGERFDWGGFWLVNDWDAGSPSLVLAPLPSESGT